MGAYIRTLCCPPGPGQAFARLEDPRDERAKFHPRVSIIVIALCVVICGADILPAQVIDQGAAYVLALKENQVHWVLDVAFHEDQSRIRAGHAAQNFTVLRHLVFNLLRQRQTKHLSIRVKRLNAGWDHAFVLQTITGV